MDQREHAMDPSKAAVSTDRTGPAAGVLFVALIVVRVGTYTNHQRAYTTEFGRAVAAANSLSMLLLLVWMIGVSTALFR